MHRRRRKTKKNKQINKLEALIKGDKKLTRGK